MRVSRLVGGMVFALLVLAAFQGYWMWQAWQMQGEILDRQIKEAMLETVERVEKAEVKYLAKQREMAEVRRALAQKSERKKKVEREEKSTPTVLTIPETQWVSRDEVIPSWVATEQAMLRQMAEVEEAFWQGLGVQLPGMRLREDAILDIEAMLQQQLVLERPRVDSLKPRKSKVVAQKAEIVRDVLTDLVDEKRSTAERVNRSMIDTLLANALRNRGIDLQFEVGVREKQEVVFASFPMSQDSLRWESAYQVPLFSEDAQLYAHFPDKDQHLWKKLRALLASSLLLFGAFGVIFYVAADTLWKQRRLSVEKSEFISNMTHEFKTPITTISLAAQALLDRSISWPTAVQDRYLGIIQSENQRLREQVEKVLQTATLESGKVGVQLEEVELDEVFQEIQSVFSLRLASLGGRLEVTGAAKTQVWADPIHLRNMLTNLLDNACKYTQGPPTIRLWVEDKENSYRIAVQDAGIGIPKDQIARVFDQFYRVSTGNLHDVKGFGLGLFYVKKMMEAHGGQCEIQSEIGKGTTVFLDFQKVA